MTGLAFTTGLAVVFVGAGFYLYAFNLVNLDVKRADRCEKRGIVIVLVGFFILSFGDKLLPLIPGFLCLAAMVLLLMKGRSASEKWSIVSTAFFALVVATVWFLTIVPIL